MTKRQPVWPEVIPLTLGKKKFNFIFLGVSPGGISDHPVSLADHLLVGKKVGLGGNFEMNN